MSDPNPERIQNAIETIVDELGGVSHLEINHYELGSGVRYTNLYCPDGISGVEDSPQNKYKLTQIAIEESSATALVPLSE